MVTLDVPWEIISSLLVIWDVISRINRHATNTEVWLMTVVDIPSLGTKALDAIGGGM